MNRLGRSGRASWLVVAVVVASCGKGTGGEGGSGIATGGSAGGTKPPAPMISSSSASIVPTQFASNGALTQWVNALTKNAIPEGKWDRSCKGGCGIITVELSVIPGAHSIDYTSLGSNRAAVAIIEPDPNAPANKTTDDPYTIQTGNFTYVVYVERDPNNPAKKWMLWHILKIPYTIVNNVRQYDVADTATLGGHHYVVCEPTHQSTSDDAGFYDCNDRHRASAERENASATAARRADTAKLLAPRELAIATGDTSRTGDPLKPLWVSCLDGCCTANGT